MTIQEMHVGIDLEFQAVNLNVWDYFQHEELDYIINKHCVKLVRNRTNPKSNVKREGFQDTHKRYEDIAELLVPAILLPYIDNSIDKTVYGILPHDYLALVADRTKSYYSCNTIIQGTPTHDDLYYCYWNFIDDTTPFYNDLVITSTTSGVPTTVFNFASVFGSYRPTGLYSLAEKFFIVNQVLHEINTNALTSMKVYWEKFDNIYKKNSFIFVDSVNTKTIQISLNGGVIASPTLNTAFAKTKLNPKTPPNTSGTFANRLTKTDVYGNYLNHSYLKTKYDSPISRLQGRRLYVHYDATFSPIDIRIDYIRKPRLVNWWLNQSCDLHENIHQEIIDNVVQELKALVNSNNYKNIINENLTLE